MIRSFCIDLGGAVVELRTPDSRWSDRAYERFGAFLTTAPPAVLVEHRPGIDGPPVTSSPSGTAFFLHGSARWEHLDALLSTLVPERVAPSLVAHGALLADEGRTFLCCGRSGAGKSTLAQLLPERALCDELALVRPTGDGFHGVSLPYWAARPGSAPLAGVFVLEHAPEHLRTRIPAAGALRELRRHVCWPTEHLDAMGQVFETLTRLVQEVPVWRLSFARDPLVWDLIRKPVA
ncbi:MAG: hypothetical protein GXP47_03890 [Acidobacteria bacterium]|nr:hypothetical protein [Acidobacteriota bacterium]